MEISADELRARMEPRTDDELHRIVANGNGEYTPAATEAAARELEARSLSGRHIADEPPPARPPIAAAPQGKQSFWGEPWGLRAFFWLSVAHLAGGTLNLVMTVIRGVTGDITTAAMWRVLATDSWSLPVAVWVLVAIKRRHAYVRWLLAAAAAVLLVVHGVEMIRSRTIGIDTEMTALVLTLWYLLRSRDLAEYEQYLQARPRAA